MLVWVQVPPPAPPPMADAKSADKPAGCLSSNQIPDERRGQGLQYGDNPIPYIFYSNQNKTHTAKDT